MKTIDQSDSLLGPVSWCARLPSFLLFSYLIFPLAGYAESRIFSGASDFEPDSYQD
jgi:hypothetical protein